MSDVIIKVCKKHGELTQDQVKKELSHGKYITYRCNQCKLEKDRRWKESNWEQHKSSAGVARSKARKDFREGITTIEPKANIWNRKDRKDNPEKYALIAKKSREKLGQERNVREVCRRVRLSPVKFHEMMTKQESKCGICGLAETRKSRSGGVASLCIDHNHTTGQVRELLCHNCNQVVGHSKESIEILQKAIEYLKRHQNEE